MALDPGPLGGLVAEFMEDLEKEYGEDAELADALVVVEVRHGQEDELESTVEARSIGERNVAALGMTVRALHAMVAPDD